MKYIMYVKFANEHEEFIIYTSVHTYITYTENKCSSNRQRIFPLPNYTNFHYISSMEVSMCLGAPYIKAFIYIHFVEIYISKTMINETDNYIKHTLTQHRNNEVH